jgi:D-hydroxyproline dehydrogenase subunit beta
MSPRVAVIGAGVIGASVAAHLARLGSQVTLLEAAYPGAGTTGTTYGWVNANAKEPREYFELNVAGMAAHRRAQAQPGGAPWLRMSGHLRWADAGGAEALAARDDRLRSWDYSVRRLGPEEVRRLEPDLNLGGARECSLYPDEGFVHPLEYLGHLLRLAEDHGARVRDGAAVAAFEGAGGRLRAAVLASGERVDADVFVVCCGRWTDEVAALAGAAVPLVPVAPGSPAVGLLGWTSPVVASVERVISSPRLNLRPDGGGRLLLHALDLDATVTPAAPPAPRSGEGDELLRRAAEVVRGLRGATLEALRVGVRPMPADGPSVCGWAPGVEGLYLAVTHSGVTLAPVLGELAAREVAGGTDEPMLRPFRPDRFASG